EVVLHDLAIDRDADLVPERREDIAERIRITDRRLELVPELVAALAARRSLPIELRTRAGVGAIRSHPEHVVLREERAVARVPPAVLEPAGVHYLRARTLDQRAAAGDIVDHALELDLEHRAQSPRMARMTA